MTQNPIIIAPIEAITGGNKVKASDQAKNPRMTIIIPNAPVKSLSLKGKLLF
jgi:hypothetical protein